jgi:hypothetical protein
MLDRLGPQRKTQYKLKYKLKYPVPLAAPVLVVLSPDSFFFIWRLQHRHRLLCTTGTTPLPQYATRIPLPSATYEPDISPILR